MLSSLFEVYDPYTFMLSLSLGWVALIFSLIFFFLKFWVLSGIFFILKKKMFVLLEGEFSSFFAGGFLKKGGILLFVGLFMYILIINLLGLIPYVFSVSSHFVFALSLSFPLWVGFMLLGWTNLTNTMFIHLIPLGTPLPLIPLMVLIETISGLIRPWSLGVRLMANMISGHLLMSLLGGCGVELYPAQLALFSFEFFVCFIQAYVFSALLTLYSSEI